MLLAPTGRHWTILSGLLRSSSAGANLTTDAHIAAYAMEHAGTVYTNDRDFGRFRRAALEKPAELRRRAQREAGPGKADKDGMG